MYSIFTTRNGQSFDFDSIEFLDKQNLIREFSGDLGILIRNDDVIGNIFSNEGEYYLDYFLYGLMSISSGLKSGDDFSFRFNGVNNYKVKNGNDRLVISLNHEQKAVNKHTFVFILKIILSEIKIFTGRTHNKNYEELLRRDGLSYMVDY